MVMPEVPAPGVQVALRNLVILPGPGAGTSGITMTAGDRLSVERCLIHGLVSGAALHVSTGALVEVTDSILRNNGNGVLAENLASIDIAGSKIVGNSSHGVFVNALVAGGTTVTISDTILSDNMVGARALASASGAVGRIYANRVTAAKNTTVGLASEATGSGVAILSVGNSLVDKNATGILQSGTSASVRSLGDNYVADNGTDVTGTLTALAPR